MIIPGMVSATFRDKAPEEILRICLEADLKAVEWSENAHVAPGDVRAAEELGRRTRAAGIHVAAYGSYYRLGQNDKPVEMFGRSLTSAAALGAPLIRVWAGTKPSEETGDKELKEMADEAAAIAEEAAAKGIKTAFEWHKNTLTDTNESAMELLRRAGHENLYCLWQPTVALSMAERTSGLDLLADRLLNLHVYYWLEGVRRPLREGAWEWKEYLRHVDQRRKRYALLEFVKDNTVEQFMEDAAVLREILEHQEGSV